MNQVIRLFCDDSSDPLFIPSLPYYSPTTSLYLCVYSCVPVHVMRDNRIGGAPANHHTRKTKTRTPYHTCTHSRTHTLAHMHRYPLTHSHTYTLTLHNKDTRGACVELDFRPPIAHRYNRDFAQNFSSALPQNAGFSNWLLSWSNVGIMCQLHHRCSRRLRRTRKPAQKTAFMRSSCIAPVSHPTTRSTTPQRQIDFIVRGHESFVDASCL